MPTEASAAAPRLPQEGEVLLFTAWFDGHYQGSGRGCHAEHQLTERSAVSSPDQRSPNVISAANTDRALLSPEEQTRADQFVFEADRDRYTAGRAWVRRRLGQLLTAPPDALLFAAGPYGKPTLAFPQTTPSLAFNVSHTKRLIALAVALRPVGIDIEDRIPDELDSVADLVMSAEERRAFVRIPDAEGRRAAFLRLWTRKEAALKALGTGLIREPRSVTVGFGPASDDQDTQLDLGSANAVWTLRSFLVGSSIVGAIALAGRMLTIVHCDRTDAPQSPLRPCTC